MHPQTKPRRFNRRFMPTREPQISRPIVHKNVRFPSIGPYYEKNGIDLLYRVVLAITKVNVDALPTLFTTYDASESYESCTIWQVARATSAATTFFKSIALGRDNVEFIDAGFGHNNPCEVLIEEAERQFPSHGGLRVLSIGTGLGDVATIRGRRDVLKALKTMVTTSTLVAGKLNRRYAASSHYYRFNVDRGLQDVTLSDWEKASTISGHTKNYLEDNRMAIQKSVDSFNNRPQGQQGAGSEPDATVSS